MDKLQKLDAELAKKQRQNKLKEETPEQRAERRRKMRELRVKRKAEDQNPLESVNESGVFINGTSSDKPVIHSVREGDLPFNLGNCTSSISSST